MTKQLPRTIDTPVVRVDFANQPLWETICAAISAPITIDGYAFYAHVSFVDDRQFENASQEELVTMLSSEHNHAVLFVVDQRTIADPESPVLVLNCQKPPGRSFRAIPSQLPLIENNLSIANMDFDEFENSVDSDGIFRGFRES